MAEAGKNGHPEQERAGSTPDADEFSPQLIGTLIHELRNPLAPIRNAAELLRTLCSDPRQLQSVEVISRQVTALTRALDDLTEVLAAKRGELSLKEQDVDVAEMVEPALRAVRPAIETRHQNLLVSLPNDPVRMNCDALRLTQVVQTLLENALWQTPQAGSIALKVSIETGVLSIEVSDDGAGIAPERLSALFNVFASKTPSAGTSQVTRPNLVIARHVVEMHGGRLEAFSDGVGRGSRFVVRLPLSLTERTHFAISRPTTNVDTRRIIIIDDYEDSVSSLRDFLASAGHSVLTANTGEIGVALAETFKPDVVIVDIGLPGIDGFEVARLLSENAATAGALLVALSGFSLKQFRELSAYSRFRHYLLKPASPETILLIVESLSDRGKEFGRRG